MCWSWDRDVGGVEQRLGWDGEGRLGLRLSLGRREGDWVRSCEREFEFGMATVKARFE